MIDSSNVDPEVVRSRRLMKKDVMAPRARVRVWCRPGIGAGAAQQFVKNDPDKDYTEIVIFTDDLSNLTERVEDRLDMLEQAKANCFEGRRKAISDALDRPVPEDERLWTEDMRAMDLKVSNTSIESEFRQMVKRGIRPFLKVEVLEQLPPMTLPEHRQLEAFSKSMAGAFKEAQGDSDEVKSLKAEIADLKKIVSDLAKKK